MSWGGKGVAGRGGVQAFDTGILPLCLVPLIWWLSCPGPAAWCHPSHPFPLSPSKPGSSCFPKGLWTPSNPGLCWAQLSVPDSEGAASPQCARTPSWRVLLKATGWPGSRCWLAVELSKRERVLRKQERLCKCTWERNLAHRHSTLPMASPLFL